MGTEDQPASEWKVTATYEDADGHSFSEESVLELTHWRRAMVTVDPVYRIAKGIQAVAFQVKNQKVPKLDFEFPAAPKSRIGRPATRRVKKHSSRKPS